MQVYRAQMAFMSIAAKPLKLPFGLVLFFISRPPAVPSWKLAAAFTPLHALIPLRFLPSSSLSHSMALQSTASSSLPCFQLSPPGKVKQIVVSTLWDSKGAESVLVTNFESDKSAAGFANFYEGDGLISSHVIMLGADPLSQDAAIEALHAYPVCV